MPSSVDSLFWIALCGVIAPLLAGLVPRRLLPEVVLLLLGGVIIGPFGLDLAAADEAMNMLSQLGVAMLFLLAGYEVELKELSGRAGRRALSTWLGCLLLALGLVAIIGETEVIHSETALAIAMTSTALGTLLPILRDSGVLRTPIGAAVMRHGAFGELGPIVAIAILLGTKGPVTSLVLLALFAGVAVVVSMPSTRLRREESKLMELIGLGSETTGQIPVRLTVLLLVTLTAVAAAFDLDSVLGSFVAGLVLRRAVPEGDERLESKLDGLAFGFLIPVFFVMSGMAIDPGAVGNELADLVIFIALMLLLRGGPVYLATRYGAGAEASLPNRDSLRVGLYAATGLPVIVAVTAVAVADGQMSSTNASVLVAGGAITVLVFPLLAALITGTASSTSSGTGTGPSGSTGPSEVRSEDPHP